MSFFYPDLDFGSVDRMNDEAIKEWPESVVSPDDNLSLREIVENFSHGRPTSVKVYDVGGSDASDPDDGDDFDYMNIDQLDLAEISELRARLSARASLLRKQLDHEKQQSIDVSNSDLSSNTVKTPDAATE